MVLVRDYGTTGGVDPSSIGRIRTLIGNVDAARTGPFAWAYIVRKTGSADGSYHVLSSLEMVDSEVTGVFIYDQNGISIEIDGNGGTETGNVDGITVAGNWFLIIVTKGAGTSTPRIHTYNYDADTWAHDDASSTIADSGTTADNLELGYSAAFGYASHLGGSKRMAVVGAWDINIGNDATIEGLGLETALTNWVNSAPVGLWPLDQEVTGIQVMDITGGNANQSLTANTNVVDDTDLDFDFDVEAPYLRETIIGDNNEDPTLQIQTSSAPQVGDSMVLVHANDHYTAAHLLEPTDAGGSWTLVETVDQGTDSGHIKVWVRTVTSAGIQTVTLNQGNGLGAENDSCQFGWLAVIKGGFMDVEDTAGGGGVNQTSMVAPSVTATSANTLLLCVWVTSSGLTNFSGFPTGMFAETEMDCGTFATSVLAREHLWDAAGATGTRTITSSTARDYVSVSIVVGVSNEVSGTFNATAPLPTSSFNATTTVEATFNATSLLPTASFTAEVGTTTATFDAVAPQATASFSATVEVSGTFHATAPLPTALFIADIETLEATFNVVSPLPQASFEADRGLVTSFDAVAPLAEASFTAIYRAGAIRIDAVTGPALTGNLIVDGPGRVTTPTPTGPGIARDVTGAAI